MAFFLGLNYGICEEQCPNPVERQHRIRIWWCIYILDRHFPKVGTPTIISDEDIFVELPSDIPEDPAHEEFGDAAYMVASIKLASITGHIIRNLYVRKKHEDSFLQRQQKLLISLKDWLRSLPEHLRLSATRGGSAPQHVIHLHLQFNQCVMLATRSILLHRLREKLGAFDGQTQSLDQIRKHNRAQESEYISRVIDTLCEACIQAARRSYSLIVEEWIQGSSPMFGYFYCSCLFACALVLVSASQIAHSSGEGNCDRNDSSFAEVMEILRVMLDHGNPSATDYHVILDKVKQSLASERSRSCGLDSGYAPPHDNARGMYNLAGASLDQHGNLNMPDSMDIQTLTPPTTTACDVPLRTFSASPNAACSTAPTLLRSPATPLLGDANLASEMQFLDQSLEDFLAKPGNDLGQLDGGAAEFEAFLDGGEFQYGGGNVDPSYWPSSMMWAP